MGNDGATTIGNWGKLARSYNIFNGPLSVLANIGRLRHGLEADSAPSLHHYFQKKKDKEGKR